MTVWLMDMGYKSKDLNIFDINPYIIVIHMTRYI